MASLTDSQKREYLLKRGWKERDVRHAWKWSLEPYVGFYLLGQAFDTQLSIERERYQAKKSKKN